MALPPDTPIICPVLIGRTSAIDALTRMWQVAVDGHGQTVVVSGEAGTGKSRLVAEMKVRAHQAGMLILEGHCFEQERSLPYAPLLEWLRRCLTGQAADDLARVLGPAASDLARLLPELAMALPGPTGGPSLAPEQEQRRLFYILAQYVIDLAGIRPLLLIVEDLHWSDDSSLAFLLSLARRIGAHPILLILTYRHDEAPSGLSHVLAELDRGRLATEIALTPLSEADVDAMLHAIFAVDQPIRRDFLEALCALTEGNPFFIEEVLKSLIAMGDIWYADGAWDRRLLGQIRIPRTVDDAVRRRVDRLSDTARATLTLAAVIGEHVDVALLRLLTGDDERALVRQVTEVVAAQLLVEQSAERLAFRHALTRRAVYAQLLGLERRALHRQVLTAIEQVYAATREAHLNELAYHAHAAGAWEPALRWGQQAGEQAMALHAPRAAVETFTWALEAARALAGAPTLPLLHQRGQAYATLGEFEAARGDLEAALTAAEMAGDRPGRWAVLLDLGHLWAARDYAQARPYVEQALALARELSEPLPIARSLNRLGNWLVNAGQPGDAVPLHEEALAIFEGAADERGVAETLDLLGLAAGHSGDAARAIACYEWAVARYRALDDRMGLVAVLLMVAQMATIHPAAPMAVPPVDPTLPVAQAEEAVAAARSIDWRAGEAYALLGLAYCLTGQGAYGRALEVASTGLVLAEEIGHRQWMVAGRGLLAGLYLELLAPALARPHLDHGQEIVVATGSAYWAAQIATIQAACCFEEGDGARAAAVIGALPEPSRIGLYPGSMVAVRVRVELALAAGRSEEALAIIDRFVALAVQTMAVDVVSPYVWLVRAEVLSRLRRAEEAAAALQSVVQTARARGAWPLVWRAQVALGRLAQAAGQRSEAAADFAAARAIIERLTEGMSDAPEPALGRVSLRVHFVAAATALLPRPRPVTSLRAAKAAYGGLTARERAVAVLVADGKTNREIAVALSVGERTVQTHIGNIFGKLGCNSRVQVAAWAVERRLRFEDVARG